MDVLELKVTSDELAKATGVRWHGYKLIRDNDSDMSYSRSLSRWEEKVRTTNEDLEGAS